MSQTQDNSTNSTSLNESFTSFTQTQNQGMGAVGDSAADIEIYMGEQSTEMTPGSPVTNSNVMGGSKPGLMGGSKPGVMGGSKPADEKKAEESESP